ncbi:TIGR03943 family putative permease subunit [Dietzia sp. 179-F 9C3 NHS]|uniref:TIGR03943 family putative permease subunit n=1 Tax=Dietzia sp. 179-F 9C3 NHS TaxID=3374295 RepID=UPI003879C173
MSRQASNLTLLLVGLALVLIVARGSYRWYVVPGMRWPLVLTGAVVLLLAVADMVRDVRSGGGAGRGDHHEHDHGSRWATWLLPVPAILLLFVGPTPVTATGAESALTSTSVGSAREPVRDREFPPLPDGHAPEIGFLELSRRAVTDRNRSLDGRPVTVEGAVLRDDDGVRLGRVVITCCAADAHTVSVRVTDARSLRLLDGTADGQWVRAEIEVVPDSATRDSGYRAAARVIRAAPIPAPEVPYELPRG